MKTLIPGVDLLLVSAVAAIACAAVLWLLIRTGLASRLALDMPNARSLHTHSIPRSGGWGVVGISVPMMIVLAPSLSWVAVLATALAALSYLDDRAGLSARMRFLAHLVAATLLVVTFGNKLSLWWLGPIVLSITWLINLYNFMDGADGLAGGMAVFGFGSFAIAAGPTDPELSLAAAAISGAAGGFLVWNLHPAKIFLGDAGSVPLGFLAGSLGYVGWCRQLWPFWFPCLVFSPFIADASVTLVKRLLRRERVWEAHREHYYQRMVRMGFGHRRTAVMWYCAMALVGLLALFLYRASTSIQLIGLSVSVLALIVAGRDIDRRWSQFLRRECLQ